MGETTTTVDETTSQTVDRPTGPGRRIFTVVVVLAVVAVAGWVAVGAYRAGQVRVALDAGALACDNATVELREVPSGYGPDGVAPVAGITEGMRCMLRVRVENRSGGTVRVHGLSVPFLGPHGGPAVQARMLNLYGVEPLPGQIDAVFELDRPVEIAAGDGERFEVHISYRPEGCTGSGTLFTFPEQPEVTVTTLRWSSTRSPLGNGFGFQGTETSSCDA